MSCYFQKHFLQFLFLLFFTFLLSCTSIGKKEKKMEETTFSEAEKKIIDDISKVIKDLPPPTVIPTTIKSIGAKYHPEIVNDLNRLDSYLINSDKAALNLGVYLTDLTYLATYNKNGEAIKHLDACSQLAESLGVNTALDMKTIRKYEEALDNPEELQELLNETIKLTEERLESSNNLNMAALVITGGYIEGLFLAVEIVKLYPRDNVSEKERNEILLPLEELILAQEQPLIDIIDMLNELPSDETINRMITELKIFKLLFDADKADLEKHKDEKGFLISEKFLIDINEEAIRIRNEIVE